jgi:hypothetical protein
MVLRFSASGRAGDARQQDELLVSLRDVILNSLFYLGRSERRLALALKRMNAPVDKGGVDVQSVLLVS